ncbi:MAG TPA: glucokinase [Telluria sp.]
MSAATTGLHMLADIGGTNARFALQAHDGQLQHIEVLPCAAHATLGDAMTAYLESAARQGAAVQSVRRAGIAIANPVEEDLVSMTNHHWSFSISQLRAERALDTLLVVNDFAALAMSLPYLEPSQRTRIGGGLELQGRPIGLIGPGTGLGVSGVIPTGTDWIALAGEGGHVSFAPANREEFAILELMWDEYGHASAERLLSGKGLELIHRALSGKEAGAAAITQAALDGSCLDARRTVDTFCAVLGSVAGNVALTLGATGGMYIGGGIVPRFGALFAQSAFRQRFEDKGRLGSYLERIPTYLITEQYPALRGMAAMLSRAH